MSTTPTAETVASAPVGAPAGLVTFLFTDIEGSTRLWEEYAEAMRVALARHDALLRQAIGQHRGYIFKTGGDAFYAAFASAPDGVAATLAAQQALATEPWPGRAVIRVRMGVHTGAAELRDGDYFGPPLNRVARMMNAGHGGQTLVSVATRDACGEAPPGRRHRSSRSASSRSRICRSRRSSTSCSIRACGRRFRRCGRSPRRRPCRRSRCCRSST